MNVKGATAPVCWSVRPYPRTRAMNPYSDFESETTERFDVGFAHRLVFTRDVMAPGNPLLEDVLRSPEGAPRPGLVAVVDAGLAESRPDLVSRFAARLEDPRLPELRETLLVPGGEKSKNDSVVVEDILAAIERCRIDRRSYVAVLGGGAVIDAAGFSASTAHRGVRLIRFASTVLAQLDAAIGVKNGVNRFGKKNFLGCFDVPTAVICDEAMLETLTDRDWCSGFSEAVKIACLKDAPFFDAIERDAERIRDRDLEAARPVIRRCADLHLRHITLAGDPFERAEARPLDFGHWAAHRLESITGFEITHGEAVSVGIALDTLYSALEGRIDDGTAERIVSTLPRLGLPVHHEALTDRRILDGLEEFREHLGGRLTVTLLAGIGDPVDVHEIDPDLVLRAADMLAVRDRG